MGVVQGILYGFCVVLHEGRYTPNQPIKRQFYNSM
jgi:hypothetical protein